MDFDLTYFQENFFSTRPSGDDNCKSATEDEFSANEEGTVDRTETYSMSPSRTQTTSPQLFPPEDKDLDPDDDTHKCEVLTTPLVPYPSSSDNHDDE